MTASYPAAIWTPTVKTDKVDLVAAEHINRAQEEIVAGQTEIGADVAGNQTNLVDRLAVMMDDNGAFVQGTSFPVTNLYDGRPFYRTDQNTLYVYNGSTWDSQGQSLSNVIFHYHGNVILTQSKGEYSGTSLNPNNALGVARFLQSDATSAETQLTGKFRKIAGVSTLIIIPRIWNRFAGETTTLTVDVGGQTRTWTETATSPTWKAANTIDVSGLSDGTTYDIAVKMHTSNSNNEAYCSDIVIFGS